MKRIIELPDNVVKAIQNGEDYRYDIHTAIAQSTPYNPTEDSAFKEEVIRMVNMGVYPETIVEWVRENGGE